MIRSLVLVGSLLAATAAYAQPAAPPAGGQTPSPAMQAARAKMTEQCAADMKQHCPDKTGPERMQCMREHAPMMSDGCKAAMQELMAARQAAAG